MLSKAILGGTLLIIVGIVMLVDTYKKYTAYKDSRVVFGMEDMFSMLCGTLIVTGLLLVYLGVARILKFIAGGT